MRRYLPLAALMILLLAACTGQGGPGVTVIYVPVTVTPTAGATIIYVPVTVTPFSPTAPVIPSQSSSTSGTPQPPSGGTPGPIPTPLSPNAGTGASPSIGGCPIFPPDNVWNTPVDTLPVHPLSDQYINSIGRDVGLHPDFGSGLWEGEPIGIPYNVIPPDTPESSVSFDYSDESDTGPYRIPPDPLIEGGPDSEGDRHILIVEQGICRLVELWSAYPQGNNQWTAGAGAIWDLNSHALRPEGWTSADGAGLPVLPGLVRYDEVAAGEINHALRFTAEETQRLFVWPARHYASDITDESVPPMGARFRLKSSFDISPYPPEVQIILRAMQRYGIILADNGSSWYINGAPDPNWDNEMLVDSFRTIHGSDFEAVDTSSLM